jgi:hypothetical protein
MKAPEVARAPHRLFVIRFDEDQFGGLNPRLDRPNAFPGKYAGRTGAAMRYIGLVFKVETGLARASYDLS